MKTIVMFTLFLLNFYSSPAQRISLAQQSPDFISADVINYTDSVIKLSDFSGKLIVIDFWNHSCVSCIRDFEKLDSLQKKFTGSLQIILANNESKDSTLRFFARHRGISLPSLPMITSAWKLWSLFTSDKTPYHVWLGRDRTLEYITGPYNLTTAHITSFLEGKKPLLANYTPEESYGGNATGIPINHAAYYSVISACDIQTGRNEFEAARVNNDQSVHLCKPCSSVKDLFCKAYGEFNRHNFHTPGQVILEMPDYYPYIYPEDDNLLDEWRQQYCYTYDLVIPVSKKEQRYQFMQEDLTRYFDLSATVEKRKLKCLALIAKGDLNKLRSKGGKPVNKLFTGGVNQSGEDTIRYLQNQPLKNFSVLLGSWIDHYLKIPFTDKTGYTGNIDIRVRNLSVDPFNLTELRKDLQQYHLDLVETTDWKDVLIIKPRKH